ncbi:MAG: hypothetical protein LQ344_006496 [Seirophora lacunosa]|nr:MAG: hypothetical protein LQ344_006496 [Seirophora lacunosa]
MERTYSDAVAALNTLQTNFATIESFREARKKRYNEQAIPEMVEWCRRTGYEPSDLDRLNPIHIAGTKGKGSTSAFVSSILSQFLPSPSQPAPLFNKIGLYTSPHLRFVRERIQINNEPLSEQSFAKYFFETWDRLEESARARGEPTDERAKPAYFRFLTLMAFHTYMSEGVDTAIIECGIGGEYDSTNIIVHPRVTGITSLGIDHTQILGHTIEEIAWHKAGIMKPGVPVHTVAQPPGAEEVLRDRAREKSVTLSVVDEYRALETWRLGLGAPFQRKNASLAIDLVSTFLRTLPAHRNTPPPPPTISPPLQPPEIRRGCEQVRWPGRCEIRREPGIAWHIDSGHTLESIQLAASWYASCISSSSSSTPTSSPPPQQPPPSTRPRILLFNQQTRDAPSLARALHATVSSALRTPRPFTHAVFCTNLTSARAGYAPDLVSMNADAHRADALEVQLGLRDAWAALHADGAVEVVVRGSVEEAVGWVRDVAAAAATPGEGGGVDVLVTGSVHLVGGFLEVLEGGGGVGG